MFLPSADKFHGFAGNLTRKPQAYPGLGFQVGKQKSEQAVFTSEQWGRAKQIGGTGSLLVSALKNGQIKTETFYDCLLCSRQL